MKSNHSIFFFLTENSFFFLCIILLIGLPFSVALVSIVTPFLLAQAVLINHHNNKVHILKSDKSLWALSSVFLIYLIGCIFCKDLKVGLYELQKTFFWLFIPLAVALSPKLSSKRLWILFTIYVSSVSLAAILTSIRIFFSDYFHISDVRDASFVAHISFSLQIVYSACILWYASLKHKPILGSVNRKIILIWSLFLVAFLSLQKSLTGFLSLYGALIAFLFYLIHGFKNHKKRSIAYGILVVIIFVPLFYIGWVTYQYFNIKDTQPDYKLTTLSGNVYNFDLQDKQKENGHFVNWYVCPKELEKSWNEVSSVKINERDASGYLIYGTLIRYLTSKGLKKDSAGVYSLSKADIANIQSGISNHIFVDKKFSIYPRIYETIWELDTYSNTGDPNDQSLSQRIEFAKTAFFIIKNHPWGIGTGNFVTEFDKAYKESNSKLDPKFRLIVHNQYLSYIVKFGFLGLILILSLIFFAINSKNQFKNILVVILIIVVGLSSLGETTLETHIGLPFFLLFLSLFCWHQDSE